MRTVYYTGPYAEGVEISLPSGGGKLAEPGEPIELPDELAEGLLEQEDIWSENPDGPKQAPAPSKATRELAEELRIDLAEVEGTGKDGRIIKSDVEAVAAGAPTSEEATSPKAGATEED